MNGSRILAETKRIRHLASGPGEMPHDPADPASGHARLDMTEIALDRLRYGMSVASNTARTGGESAEGVKLAAADRSV